MARPIKRGLNYFPFDIDFFQDEKVVCVAGEFGLKAEITIVKLLCAVYRNGYFLEWNEMQLMKLLHQLPGLSSELISQIVMRLVKWGFFDKDLFDKGIITSRNIQLRWVKLTQFVGEDFINSEYNLIRDKSVEEFMLWRKRKNE